MSSPFEDPLDLLKQSLGEVVFVRTRNNCEIRGRLVCYDAHLNMMLSKLTVTRPGQADREHNLLYLRGDGIVLLSPDK